MNTDRDSKDSATQRAYLILTEVQPAYEPAVVERCRFDVRVHGVQQLETTATSTRAHVQQFAVASTTETTLSDMSCVRTPSWNRPQPRRSPTKTSRWCVGSFFELPLSDVTVVDGEKAVLECRVTVMPAAEGTWYVENVEIRQTGDCHIVSIEQESIGVTVTIRIRPDEGRRQVEGRNDVDVVEGRSRG